MLGHAAANLTPVIASNRVGVETFDASSITFYGNCFFAFFIVVACTPSPHKA